MNLATLSINEGWPTQSQFYYCNKLSNANGEDSRLNDSNFEKENQLEIENSPHGLSEAPMDAGNNSEGLYFSQNCPLIPEDDYPNGFERKPSQQYLPGNNNPVDTTNSNFSRNSSFVTNYSHFPLLNQSQSQPSRISSNHDNNNNNLGEKKFISELHINIKDTSSNDGETKTVINSNNNTFQSEFGSYNRLLLDNSNLQNGYHLSRFDAFISGQQNPPENQSRINTNKKLLDVNRSSSSAESPNQKRECHHSEKFIYLGCETTQITPQKSELEEEEEEDENHEMNSYNSPKTFQKMAQKPYVIRSREFENNNEDMKSFSTKSVQTSKKLDCIFKTTCDRSVETEMLKESNKKLKEGNGKVMGNTNRHLLTKKPSLESNESSSSENYSEIKLKRYEMRDNMYETKKLSRVEKKYQKSPPKENPKNQCPNPDDTNQDTYAGSYSESFSHSNDLNELPEKQKVVMMDKYEEKHSKHTINKTESKKLTISKNNCVNGGNKSNTKNQLKKVFSDKKEKEEFNDRNNLNTDLKNNYVSKDDTDRHSLKIQCLLDNLNTHLQNTVNSHTKPVKISSSKVTQNNQFNNNIGSFWDNPLNPETTRSLLMGKQSSPKITEPLKQKSVNPEIQAIFETLEKSHNYEKQDPSRVQPKKSPSIDLNVRNQKSHNMTMGDTNSVKMAGDGLGSLDYLDDARFPSSLKFQKLFDLSPYDELIKSHLNSSDRRIKSVAAKNGCRIVIDGPISLVDPTTTCQAIRNKIAYRCIVAGPSKDRLDKCLNYLKETFPNTCLRLHNRNSLGFKS